MVSGTLDHDIHYLKTMFQQSSDLVYRSFQIGNQQDGQLIYFSGFVDQKTLDSAIMKPLLAYQDNTESGTMFSTHDMDAFVLNQVFSVGKISTGRKLQDVADHILSGGAVILIDGVPQALFISATSREQRAIEEPTTEAVVRGPKEGFIENIQTNISLVRRRLKTHRLKVKPTKIGRLSQTDIAITYIDGIVDPDLIEEVQQRLNRIDIDAIEESGYIEELLEDNPYSIFPQMLNTERPDRLVGHLLEGKVGILIDNTPFVLILPITFYEMMTASEDYYGRYMISSAIRLLRYLFLLIAIFFPSIYIAVTTFHQELMPTNLLFSVAASRENVPFPAIVEVFLMEISFEALREAGVRLPKPVGQAVSIAGALVIGESAVQAGLVSAPLVIVVAITGIASFMIPSYSLSGGIRVVRFGMMILTSILGMYGLLLGGFLILIHMARLRSFGVPYSAPIAPLHVSDLKDVFIRVPWWAMIKRPQETAKRAPQRMKKFLRPHHHSKRKH